MQSARILLLGLLLALPLNGNAQIKNKAGTSGFQFLKIGVGARETALGESATAIAEGPAAIFWNVAGLAKTKNVSALFFHNSWIASMTHSFMAINVPVGENHAVGVALTLLTMDDMEETTIESPHGTGRRFGAGDFAVSLSYAQQISERFGAGLTIKYVNEHIWDLVADGWALDVALQYRIERFSIGMAFKDFGTNKLITGNQLESNQNIYENWDTAPALISLVPKEIRLPMSFHLGAGYEVLASEDHRVLATGNIVYFNDIGETQNVGVEYTLLGAYSLRAGYRFNRDAFSLSGGIGVKAAIGPTTLQLDFAALQMKDFGYRTQIDALICF